MKWPSLDESVSLCICLLTVACNREKQPFFIGYLLWGKKNVGFGSGSGSKFNCAARVGLGQPISVTGFNFKPVQT